jgi:pimeloyl-ACP methyl ester carboxylesterase
VCAFSYPGFGGSSGRATLSSLAPAALAAFDAVSARAAGRPILLAGHSMGTVVALVVAARRNVAGLVLHNPPPLRELILGRFGWCTLWIGAHMVARGVPPELDSLANARLATAPAVFLLGSRDSLVTQPYQRMIVDAYQGPKQIVDLPEGCHDTPIRQEDLPAIQPPMDWLWSGTKLEP